MSACLFRLISCVSHDDNLVTCAYTSCCCSVQTDHTASAFSADCVCLESTAIVHIYNLNFLIFQYSGSFQQFFIHSNASHIIQFSLDNSCSVDFSFLTFLLSSYIVLSCGKNQSQQHHKRKYTFMIQKKRIRIHFDPETLLIDSLYIESCFWYIKYVLLFHRLLEIWFLYHKYRLVSFKITYIPPFPFPDSGWLLFI